MDGRIFHLKKLLIEKPHRSWTVEEMAEIAQISTPHLIRLFKIHLGMPPNTYLRELRLEKARELLESSYHQVKQIGVKSGMTNDSHFTRDFKKKFGLSPTDYRKKFWEKIQAEERVDQQ